MNKHQEYLKNLQKEKWAIVHGRSNGNCQHPEREGTTCGEYKNSVLLTPAGGNQIVVPVGYCPRSELWICPKHLPNYEITHRNQPIRENESK